MSLTSNLLALTMLFAVMQFARGHVPYNSTTQICCNGAVSDKPNSETTSCCGSSAYDFTTSLCCVPGQVLKVPHGDDAFGYGCCHDKASGVSSIFNARKQQCCNGKVLDKPDPEGFYGCCSGELYNMSSHRCCGGKLSEHNDMFSCCGDKELYNPETHICCGKHRFDVGKVRGALDSQVSLRTSNTTACCNLKAYDFRSDVCCGDVVTPKTKDIDADTWGACCEGVPYDSFKKICCIEWGETGVVASALHDINNDSSTSCCGARSFDSRKEVCCRDKIVPKPEGSTDQWMQCCGDLLITNSTTQVCVNDKIYEREDINFYVCGDQLFDTRKQACCGDQLIDTNSTLSCCFGAKVFDTTTHQCCFDTVQPLTKEDLEANNDACCTALFLHSN